jgi:octaprenyl-diphosphate synthase
MAMGEALELQFEGCFGLAEEEYLQVIRAKTASLMAAACELGALRGGTRAAAARRRRQRFRRFGRAVGMAFQIADDVIDLLGHPAETGKRLGTDLREGKVTLPLIHALGRLRGTRRARLTALASRRRLGRGEFRELVGLITAGDGFTYATARARAYARQAQRLLALEPASPVKEALGHAVDYAVGRTR